MNAHSPERRRHFLRIGMALVATTFSCVTLALDAPAGKVVLTLSGDIQSRNTAEGAAAFDMAMLEKLPQHSFSTRTPWYPEPRKFTGVTLRDLLNAVGGKGKTLKAIALNDYRVEFPVDEALRGEVLVAYALDDKPMLVRDKGPLVLMFPFDARADLRTAVNYSRAAWQLKALELH
jgi:hypothetical protein